MAPIKIEDNIREKLQERELPPSKEAWSKLESRLGKEHKERISRTGWLAIAAGFIGILIVASVFMNGNSTGKSNELVKEEHPSLKKEQINPENQPQPVVSEDMQPELALEESPLVENKSDALTPKKQQQQAKNTTDKKSLNNTTEAVLAENKTMVQQANPNELIQSPVFDETKFINNKVEEVVAEVKRIEQSNIAVTPEEIDALLAQAQLEIGNRRILISQSGKVDAAALLLDVEYELERSFRDKVFDALGDGYKKVRTAMVERNN